MLNLKKSNGTSFESQENYRMVKMKFGNENFFFEVFTEDMVPNTIKNLATYKASVSNDTSLYYESHWCLLPKTNTNHKWLFVWKTIFFLIYIIKNAEITTCFKKRDKGEKDNYRSVSILSDFSKVFKWLIYNQLNEY